MSTLTRLLFSSRRHCLGLGLRSQSNITTLTPRQDGTQRLRLGGQRWVSPHLQAVRCLRMSSVNAEEQNRRKWPFHLTMSEEEKQRKQAKIEAAKLEEKPTGIFGKVKFYFKRYWYIAVPAHTISCLSWFGVFYAVVHSGVNIPSLLEKLHMPVWIIEKVNEVPESAGVVVVALILYKIATPIRYLTTLGLIQVIFATLRRMGKLKTAREVEFRVRSDYEMMKKTIGRRGWTYTGVRSFTSRKRAAAEKEAKEARGDKTD